MTQATPSGSTFGSRLARVFAERGQLCVGIDPHAWLLAEWGLADSAAGAEAFGRRVVEASAGLAGIVKPQVAFYERFGSAGYVALERVLADARAAGLLVIADVKRGEIGTSMEAYGEAWLTPGSPLEADAITVNPFLGVGSLAGAFDHARAAGKGAFVLAATSNPEGEALQTARIDAPDGRPGRSVARSILDDVTDGNARDTAEGSMGSVGVVLGATLDLARFGIDVTASVARAVVPVLAPGFGHQGASIAELDTIFGSLAAGVIVSESRSVLSAGPDRLEDSIARRVSEIGAVRG